MLERLLYGLFWLAGALIYRIPFRLKSALCSGLAWIWFHVVRFRRLVILHNLAAVFPRRNEESMAEFQFRCEQLAIRNMRHILLTLLEVFERFHWTPETIRERIRMNGLEQLRTKVPAGKGLFFLTAHLGNWELITITGMYLGFPLSIITKKLRNSFFDRLWVRSRRRYGLQLLEESGSGLSIVRAIREGRAVGFILDQHTGEPHGIETTFLGLKAWCPKGLAILSNRLSCPIVPAYMLREEDGTYRLEVGAPLTFPELEASRSESGALTEQGLRYHLRICNENIEQWIHKAPDQYLWMHRRFKNVLDYRARLPWQL